jgi:hypothetical protein
LYVNCELAFFSLSDAAEFFISGQGMQILECCFFHGSYSNASNLPEDVVICYASSSSKPGFPRAMLGTFDNRALAADASCFKEPLGKEPLRMPVPT